MSPGHWPLRCCRPMASYWATGTSLTFCSSGMAAPSCRLLRIESLLERGPVDAAKRSRDSVRRPLLSPLASDYRFFCLFTLYRCCVLSMWLAGREHTTHTQPNFLASFSFCGVAVVLCVLLLMFIINLYIILGSTHNRQRATGAGLVHMPYNIICIAYIYVLYILSSLSAICCSGPLGAL
jgi:hypothetical protein